MPSALTAGADAASGTDAGECTLAPVYFGYDSNELDPGARAALERNALCMKRSAGVAAVVGMTDPRGSEEYNLALGERRAQTAARYLSALGVDSERLLPRSLGEEYAKGSDESGWTLDRRAEVSSP